MKTINLLPPVRQKLLQQEVVFRTLLTLVGYSVLGFVLAHSVPTIETFVDNCPGKTNPARKYLPNPSNRGGWWAG